MSSVPSIALSGMNAAMRSLEASARRVADMSVSTSGQGSAAPAAAGNGGPSGTGGASGVNLASEAVTQLTARYDFAFNAVVLHQYAQMTQSFLDMMA